MTAQQLETAASCIDCSIPEGLRLPVLIALFAEIAGASMDPQILVTAASCINCSIPQGDQMGVLIALAGEILTGGGTGGGGGVAVGNGAPTSTPLTDGALYIQKDSVPPGQVWEWYDSAWH